jgi:hypothetical protein
MVFGELFGKTRQLWCKTTFHDNTSHRDPVWQRTISPTPFT